MHGWEYVGGYWMSRSFAGAAWLLSAQWEKVKGGSLFEKRQAGTDVNAGGHEDQ